MDTTEQDIIWLLQQPSFKEWVFSPTNEHHIYWQKWVEKNPEKQTAFLKAQELIKRIHFRDNQLSDGEIESILDHIVAAPINSRDRNTGLEIFQRQWLRVAALLALVFSISFVSYKLNQNPQTSPIKYITKTNHEGQKNQFTLPDGSTVNLNAQSELSFPETFSDSFRIVKLSGEAFFQVTRDVNKPFKVITDDIVTTVLGTSFNINAYPETRKIHIALVSGKVAVKRNSPNDQEYIIKPGEKIVFDQTSGYETIGSFDQLQETGWKDGILIFENTGFPEFLSTLERWYGVEFLVIGKPADTWQIEGSFNNESLEEILKGVMFTHNLTYDINNKRVTIKF